VETERIRALTLQRLAGVADPERHQATVAPVPTSDSDASDDTDPTNPSQAAPAAGVSAADEAIDMTDSVDQASTAKVRQPLVFRIAGIDEPPTQVPADPDIDATPLVMFLEAPGPAWPAVPTPPSDDPTVVVDEPAQDTLLPGDRTDLEPVAASEVAGSVAEPPANVPAAASVEARAYCPYCATILQPPPTSDRRCSECKQQIVVRHIDDRTVWLTEAVLPVFEAERRRIADLERWTVSRAHWLDLALTIGAPKGKVAKAAEEVPSEAKVSAARDLYLSSVDRSFATAARDDQWAVAARIRFAEALVLFDFAGAPIPEIREGDDS
jgi:hypothetical protein